MAAMINAKDANMPVLTLSKVTKTFGSGHTEVDALKGVDFSVSRGEFVSVIGPSGSGKSTFLTIAGGLQSPTSGVVSLDGADLGALSDAKRTRLRFEKIGFVLQRSNLVPYLKVGEQFALVDKVAKRGVRSSNIDELLTSLDIAALKDKYPRDLSGGERQRVAIGRALFNDPSLILADEPTASLDSDHAYAVVKLLAKLTREQGKATVMVTHDERMAQWSDRIYRMEDGSLSVK
ncbi:MAG: ABC transporter ATP-binding protein [Bifidobacteriaceae bacterium]|jgi:putative ABC transport system ATP-binding protein|nr:ABC transporter ATP-binding protein [Bifidobacteriaceae bacterium]